MNELEEQYLNIQNQLIDAKRELAAKERSYQHLNKQFFEAGERYKSNLRTVHFMLTEVQNVGTHHEKEVVLRYIKQVIEKQIFKPVCHYPDMDDLPF